MPANRCIDCNAKLPDDGSDDAVCARCAANYDTGDNSTNLSAEDRATWDAVVARMRKPCAS